mmetsp:Transcript_3028/g.8504  ORF Transcript_3028/g.8504 Transcript_3028/m.8504 type:complete len:211 (-) Transcript_3028:85-717(-)
MLKTLIHHHMTSFHEIIDRAVIASQQRMANVNSPSLGRASNHVVSQSRGGGQRRRTRGPVALSNPGSPDGRRKPSASTSPQIVAQTDPAFRRASDLDQTTEEIIASAVETSQDPGSSLNAAPSNGEMQQLLRSHNQSKANNASGEEDAGFRGVAPPRMEVVEQFGARHGMVHAAVGTGVITNWKGTAVATASLTLAGGTGDVGGLRDGVA